jgi:hypothetical protein
MTLFQKLDIPLSSLSIANIGQDLEHLADAFTAGDTFAARLMREELEKISG